MLIRAFLVGLFSLWVACWPARAAMVVGTGPDSSYLVLEASAWGAPLVYEWRYSYDPLLPPDGYALLHAVVLADPLLEIPGGGLINYGTASDPSYFLNALTYNSITLTSAAAPPWTPYWAQWISGGTGWNFFADEPVSVASGVWEFGSGMTDPYRQLAPGSWDAFFFSNGSTPPSVMPAAIPEPSAFLLISLGLIPLARQWRLAE